MTYQVLARKYRPQSFKEVVGQEHIVRTLSNAISQNRIHHAYLFSGGRGTGKTTMARLLAKALNCADGPTVDICQKCDACQGILKGGFVDVQEIDGASNRGIDEIRELRANVRFAPVSGRYKIYIIDEAHQITGAAFNALLKTLEEPPAHAVFILATTEPQSIPQTIASRCQKYNFRLLSIEELSNALKKISESEKINADSAAIELIARAANGSMRDAQSILDQAMAFCGDKLTGDKLKEMLGTLPAEFIDKTFGALMNEDAGAAVRLIEDISRSGHDLSIFINDLLYYCHLLILKKTNVESAVSEEENKMLNKYSDKFGLERILRFSRLLLRAKDELRWTDDIVFLLEIYLVKMTLPFADVNLIKEMLSKGSLAPTADDKRSQAAQKVAAELPRENKQATCDGDLWRGFLVSLPASEQRIKNILKNAALKNISDASAELEASSEFVQKELLLKKRDVEALLGKYVGKQLSVNITSAEAKKQRTEKHQETEEDKPPLDDSMFASPQAEREPARKNYPESIKKFLNVFPGKVENIEKTSIDKKTC